jgi:hypothetical protein
MDQARQSLRQVLQLFESEGVPRPFAIELIILELYRIKPAFARELDKKLAAMGVPYFAHRKPSKAFAKLDASGKTGSGTNVTQLISQDREDRV